MTTIALPHYQPRMVLAALGAGGAVGLAFAFQHPLLGIAAALGVALVGIVLRSPFVGILLVVFFLPFERIGAYESALGTIRASQVIAAITIGIWSLITLVRRQRLAPNPLTVPLLLFLAANVFGLSQALNLQYTTSVLLLTAFTALFGWVVPQIVRTHDQLRVVVWVLLACATIASLFGLFQFVGDFIGLPTSVTGLRELYTKDVFGFPRVQSTALEPLYFANFLLLPIGILYAFFLGKARRFPSWLVFCLLGLFLANLALTVSRGGYLGALVMLAAITLMRLRHFLRWRVILPIGIGGLTVLLIVTRLIGFGDVAGTNIETFTSHVQNVFFGASFSERVETIEQAQSAFRLSPWFGIGPGSFGPFVAIHPLVEPLEGWRIVNNETMELLAETGVLGLLAMLAVVGILLTRSVKALLRSTDSTTRLILIGTTGALLGILVQYQTFSVLYIMHVWFLVGLLIAAQNLLLPSTSKATT